MKIIGKIVRDKRHKNIIWCLCNNYEEYVQFAKDLFLFTGLTNLVGVYDEYRRWVDDELKWSELFGVDLIKGEDEENDEYWEGAVDPINDVYEIKEKPDDDEYPVAVQYDDFYKNLLWVSLERLKKM